MKIKSNFRAFSAIVLVAAAFSGPAFAHVVLQEKQAERGSTYRGVLVVGHGCEGEATTGLRVQIPEGLYNVKPMPKAGWTVSTVVGDYAVPFSNHGTEMTKGVREISWTGGNLPDDFFDEFTFRGTVGPEVDTSKPLYFPVIQTCGAHESAWIDKSGDHDAEFPAPAVTISAAKAEGHTH